MVLYWDKALAHSTLSVKKFLEKHPSVRYSDLFTGSCTFYLFSKEKFALKGTRFESVEVVKEKEAKVL